MIDAALQSVSLIWAAAGALNAVFALEFAESAGLTGVTVLVGAFWAPVAMSCP